MQGSDLGGTSAVQFAKFGFRALWLLQVEPSPSLALTPRDAATRKRLRGHRDGTGCRLPHQIRRSGAALQWSDRPTPAGGRRRSAEARAPGPAASSLPHPSRGGSWSGERTRGGAGEEPRPRRPRRRQVWMRRRCAAVHSRPRRQAPRAQGPGPPHRRTFATGFDLCAT